MRLFWKFFLYLTGWKAAGALPTSYRPSIIIVAPHTSNWDFIYGLAFRSVLRLTDAKFLGKKELFRPPFGFLFRWLGGYPVDRASSHNMVEQVAGYFRNDPTFAIAISPEGTRKKVDKLKTGFYHIARKARVPIIMAALDYGNKQVVFHAPLYTTDDQEADFEKILSFYRPVVGKNPERGLMHL